MVRDATLRRLVPAAAAAAFLAGMATLYALGLRAPYMAIIRGWGIDPWPFPFLDTDTILSAVRCRQAGIDVYAANPCDVLGRVYDYSPLWLAGAVHVPGLGAHIVALGLAVDLGFLLALTLLPPARRWRDVAIVAAGALSSASLFAVERGNNDLVIFALAAAAAALSCRSRRMRLIGYAAALLAGLLKYYPMTLMVLAAREAPKRLALIACAAIATVALFVAIDGHDLARALALIPEGSFIGVMFGSSTLAGGLVGLFGLPDPMRPLVQTAMTLAALAAMVRLGSRTGIGEDVAALTPRERAFLLAGAMLTLGCFFTAQNIGYRAVHLVLVLPALTALRSIAAGRRRYGDTLVAVLALLWAEGWRAAVGHATSGLSGDTAAACKITAWLLREGLWWWTIVALGSLAVAILLRSTSGVAMLGGLRAIAPLRARLGAGGLPAA